MNIEFAYMAISGIQPASAVRKKDPMQAEIRDPSNINYNYLTREHHNT
jgi:hypothetical protein